MLEEFVKENLIKTENYIKIPAKEIYERYVYIYRKKGVTNISKFHFYRQLENNLGPIKNGKFEGWYLRACKY